MHGGVKFDGDVFKHEMENKQREKEKKLRSYLILANHRQLLT